MAYIKGQQLRISVDETVVALATTCSVHLSVQLESASTKDDGDDWERQTVTGKSWNMSTDALFSAISARQLSLDLVAGTEVNIEFVSTKPDESSLTYSGSAIVSDITVNAPNRQNATFSVQFTGTGPLNVE